MYFNEWRNRYKHKNDISSRLTHLTKGDSSEQAFSTLLKILEEKGLNGNKPDGLVLPSKRIKQEPPQAATCGGSICVSSELIFSCLLEL